MKFKKQNWLKLGLELFVVFLGITAGFLLNNWESNVVSYPIGICLSILGLQLLNTFT